MITRCPGQDGKNLKIEIVACPDCKYRLEIFSDEVNVKCPMCKSLVCRKRLPSCADWCKAAEECIGKEKWRQLKKPLR